MFPAGHQPRPSVASVPRRTSTATIRGQCSLPDLNREAEDLPDRTPERMSEDIPERMSEEMPERMSEEMPERMSGGLSERMSESISEDMPERMSEEMSERMSEDMHLCYDCKVTRSQMQNLHRTETHASIFKLFAAALGVPSYGSNSRITRPSCQTA